MDCPGSRRILGLSTSAAPLDAGEDGLHPMAISYCARGRPSADTDVQALRLEVGEAPALSQISPSGAVGDDKKLQVVVSFQIYVSSMPTIVSSV